MKFNRFFLYSPLFLQTAIWPITRPVLKFFLRWRVYGLEKFRHLERGIIFVVNHSSELDPILIPASLPFLSKFMPMFYVSRPNNFYKRSGWRKIFYGGFIFKIWGAHSAIGGSHDYRVSLAPHLFILEEGGSVIIFPEGHKTRDGSVMITESRGGAPYLAERVNRPIVPVLVDGIFNMTLGEFLKRRRHLVITFGSPLYATDIFDKKDYTDDIEDNRYKKAARYVMSLISKLEPISKPIADQPTFKEEMVKEKNV